MQTSDGERGIVVARERYRGDQGSANIIIENPMGGESPPPPKIGLLVMQVEGTAELQYGVISPSINHLQCMFMFREICNLLLKVLVFSETCDFLLNYPSQWFEPR